MRLTYKLQNGSTQTFEAAGERTHFPPSRENPLHVFAYTTEAGGVTKHTVAIVAGAPRTGFVGLEGLVMNTDDETYTFPGHFGVVPGGIWSHTMYEGNPLRYWQARGRMERVPEWAPAKLGYPEPVPQIGPYSPMWAQSGWAKGGQGIESNWFEWRTCPQGYLRAFDEVQNTAMRNPFAYLLSEGHSKWWSQPAFTATCFTRPEGYSYNLDDAAEWWPGARELAEYQQHDGQHIHRAYRAALELRHVDPFAKDVAGWVLGHAELAWWPDPERNGAYPYLWTAEQLYEHLFQHPGPHPGLGREFAHVARLVWTLSVGGPLAEMMEDIVRLAADENGICYLTNNKSELNGDWGAYHPDSPWKYPDLCAQVFQWNILNDALKLRPGLADIVERFEAFVPPKTRWYSDGKGTYYGGTVPLQHLYRDDLDGVPVEEYLAHAASPGVTVEAHGGNPLNYMKRRIWQDHI